MRKESECEFCELCREFYEGKKKECKGPEHCKIITIFWPGNAQHWKASGNNEGRSNHGTIK